MATWDQVIKDPEFQTLPPSGQAAVRQQWFDMTVLPELQATGIDEQNLNALRHNLITEFDNGQGYISSFGASAARGALGTISSAVQGAGALTGSADIEGAGTSLQRGIEETFPVNPLDTKTNFVGNALGNAAMFLGTGGAGSAVGRGLGIGARLGANIGSLGTGFFAGAGGAAQEADQYGIVGEDRRLKALLGGIAEVGSEMVFGTGAEMRALSKIPGFRSVADDAGKMALTGLGGAAHAIGTEAAEEVIAQAAGNLSTNLLAPPGVKGPDFTQGFGESALGGAIGGALFGGVHLLGTHKSDAMAGRAATRSAAAGDQAAADVVVDVASGIVPRTVIATSSFTGAPAGDQSINERINLDPNAAPGAGPPTVSSSGAPVPGMSETITSPGAAVPGASSTSSTTTLTDPTILAPGADPNALPVPPVTPEAPAAPTPETPGAAAALMPIEERNERMVRLYNLRGELAAGPASPETKAQAVEDMEKLSGLAPGTLEYVRAGNSKVFRNKLTGEFVKFDVQPIDEASGIERRVNFLKENDPTTRFHAPLTFTILGEGASVLTQAPVGIEGADAIGKAQDIGITKEERAADDLLFKKLAEQNPLLSKKHEMNSALAVETDLSLKNAGLVVGPDGMVRAYAFDYDTLTQEQQDKDGQEAAEILKNTPDMAGVPLTSFSPSMQQAILAGQNQSQAQAPAQAPAAQTQQTALADLPQTKTLADFNDPNTAYRVVVGDDAFQDIVDSGTVRTGGRKFTPKEEGKIKLTERPTAFPSFSKGEVSIEYANNNPNHYVVESEDPSIKVMMRGRHGKGSTHFPVDAQGKSLSEYSSKNVRVYRHDGGGNYSLVYAYGAPVTPATQAPAQTPQAPQAPAQTQATLQQPNTSSSTGQTTTQQVQGIPGQQAEAPVQEVPQTGQPQVAPTQNGKLKLPTRPPKMSMEEEARLIDTEGRITPEAALQVFGALKDLGVTDADVVLTDGEQYEGGPKNVVLGQVVTENGQARVELNRNMVRADTPVHEGAGHGALRLLARLNPALDAAFRKVLVGSPLMEAVKQRYERANLKYTEEELYEETLATAYGNNTAKFWGEYAKNPGFVRKIKQLLARFQTWMRDRLKGRGIDPNMTMGDLAKRVNQMILSGQLTEKKATQGQQQQQQGTTTKPSLPPPPAGYAEAMARYKDTPSTTTVSGRTFSPIVRDMLQRRKAAREAGTTTDITPEILDHAIKEHFPSYPVPVPKTMEDIPSQEEILAAVKVNQREAHEESKGLMQPGQKFSARQDVDAMKFHNVGVVTARFTTPDGEVHHSYLPAVRMNNPKFVTNEVATEKIGTNEKPKGPHIAINGEWAADQSMPTDLENWTQIGFNPDRSSNYYERGTGRQVTGADEIFQIGNTVFARNAKFENKRTERSYSLAPSSMSDEELTDKASARMEQTQENRQVAGDNFAALKPDIVKLGANPLQRKILTDRMNEIEQRIRSGSITRDYFNQVFRPEYTRANPNWTQADKDRINGALAPVVESLRFEGATQPVSGEWRDIEANTLQGTRGERSSVSYSLAPPKGVRQSGVARNRPDSMTRSHFINLSYATENKGEAWDQAKTEYDRVTDEHQGDPEKHMAVLQGLIANAGTRGTYNMTAGAYFGMFLGDLNAMATDENASEAQRSWAEEYLVELGYVWANVAADKGQFIKGFDAGLSIANVPRLQVRWAEALMGFNGDASLRREFDKEKSNVIRIGEEFTKEQLVNVPVSNTANAVGLGINDIAKGEDAADAGNFTMEDLVEPGIEEMEDQGDVSEGNLFIAGYDALTKASQAVFNELLEHMEYMSLLNVHLKNGQPSLVPGAAERSAAARKRLDDFLASSPKSKLDIQTEIAATQKKVDAALKRLKSGLMPATPKAVTPVGAAPAAAAPDIQKMATDRLFKAITGLIAGPKKGSATTVAEKTANAIVTAILNKSGLTNQLGASADNMTMALGLLLANQDTAATVVQQVHTMLQNDDATRDALTRDDLKAFMQLAIGKEFDTATGASTAAKPYTEKQIATALRAELKKAGIELQKTVRDAATAREARQTLEDKLRAADGPLAKNLSKEDLNKVVNAVLAEYEKTAKERATQLAKEQAALAHKQETIDAFVKAREAAREASRERTREAKRVAKEAEDALKAQQKAYDKEKDAEVKAAMKQYNDDLRAAKKAADKEAARIEKEEKKAIRELNREARRLMAEENKNIMSDLRFRMRLERQARAEQRQKRKEEMEQARAAGTAVPSPDPLNWKEIKELNKKLAEDPHNALAILVREFGFDLSAAVTIIREQGRYDKLEQMTKTLADALGMTKTQAAKFVQPVIGAAMTQVEEKRAKQVEKKIADFIRRKDTPDKKTQLTEAQKLMNLVRLGGLTADNVEDVMLNTRGAKKFDDEFRKKLIDLAERANDLSLPDSEKAELTATFNDLIKAARGVSVLGVWGEAIMSNIFMAIGTFKVNAIWGAVKSFSDTFAYVGRFDPFNLNPEAQITNAERKILIKQKVRGFNSDMQYHFKYLWKTGKSPLEYDMTTQFSNSDLELISRIPETEIKKWLDGEPMTPFFQKYTKLLTKYHKWTRRIMVGTDIYNRTPAYEMIKGNKLLQIMSEKGIPRTQAEFDKHMYGEGGFDKAREESWAEVEKAVAEGRVREDSKGLYFGELMDKRLGAELGISDEDRNMLLEKAAEEAKRWTVANLTEGLLGGITNSLLNTVRDTPGLKFLLPAIRMPIGAFAQGLDWSPWGFLRAQAIGWNKGLSSSVTNAMLNRHGERKNWNLPAYGVPSEMVIELRNKAAVGTALMTALALIIQAGYDDDEDEADFYITAKGPEDAQANKLWREKGMQPFTIRIGGVNIRYQESPAYGPLVALGAWSDANRYAEAGASNSDRISYAMMRTVSAFGEAAVLSSLQSVLAAFTGGGAGIDQTVSKFEKAMGRLTGVALAPRIGSEIEQILFGAKDMKEGGFFGYMFANVPFVSTILNKPAINFFGEELHAVRGVAGEALPMAVHRLGTSLTDDPQARFVAKIGANKLTTTRRFRDGTEVAENYEAMREWGKTSGQAIRKWLTPERIAYFEKQLARDRGDAEKEFDSEIRRIRDNELKKIKGVVF